MDNQEYLNNLRHSCAHLLAAAVMKLWPGTKRAIGPSIEDGFYFDFEFPQPISEKDFPKIEKTMREIVKKWDGFERHELSKEEAKKEYPDNSYKHELIDEFSSKGEKLSFYKSGDYWDLCRGGHIENPKKELQYFKLLSVAGAYWRGDEKNPMLTRIYATCFPSKKELEDYLWQQEEVKKRDHRVLGPKLNLFFFDEAAPGIPFYTPKGDVVRDTLRNFVRDVSYGEGYQEVKLPLIFDNQIWKKSGHWEHFKDDMFILKVEGRDFALKPMNCPGHMVLYKHGQYSYRDLPIRFAEMSSLHRNELSGTLSGLTRVRAFVQDDTHIFLTPDQITMEVIDLLDKIKKIYAVFKMKIEDVHLSTRPDKALGEPKEWDQAEHALAVALKKAGWKYKISPGEGAFYGPKIDMQIKDILGRKWQLATIQLDFQMPKRFELEYVDKDGNKKTPIVIHRALLGSFERFLAILIEQYAGAFPAWLAPIQAIVLPISEKQNKYARQIAESLKKEKIKAQLDDRNESVGRKIREAELQKIPYMLIVGEKEVKDRSVAVRARNQPARRSLGEGRKDLGAMMLDKFIKKICEEIETRALS